MLNRCHVVVLGLSISSSWGNGHATTYRSLLGALARRGHDVLFLERDVPWYAAHRDLRDWDSVRVGFYTSLEDLACQYRSAVEAADVVIVGSCVPEGPEVLEWARRSTNGVLMFYDIDTPITLAALESGQPCEYLRPDQLRLVDSVLSFTAGHALDRLCALGAPRAHALCCSVDPTIHLPVVEETRWDIGYLGTYAPDRQPGLEALMLDVARTRPWGRYAVAGPMYPDTVAWPANVDRVDHLPPAAHAPFYCGQRFTLNLTRADMRRLGHSPSVRLFEAAACGAAIISDEWPGLEDFFEPYIEILPAATRADVEQYLDMPDAARRTLGLRARERVLAAHTAEHRAIEFEAYAAEAMGLHQLARSRVAQGQ
ncbi:glycosyl transferase [Luteitalea sp. TBR-22]|uniref:CgeB family protein n=1 Tax=Luteitalea sp. TBR-22 TaxID=2802971 RepID=UPI001AF792D5|nr:glycosyltransferase [Luteitalea sp. TBR-22]BCS33659.1 glycosyl transferase [Luteitalea sp. TBR-22]